MALRKWKRWLQQEENVDDRFFSMILDTDEQSVKEIVPEQYSSLRPEGNVLQDSRECCISSESGIQCFSYD
jgi:hypothetical protein